MEVVSPMAADDLFPLNAAPRSDLQGPGQLLSVEAKHEAVLGRLATQGTFEWPKHITDLN